MGNPSLLYRSVKSIENEGVSTFLHKGKRYISERLVEFYYLNMHTSSADNVLERNYYYFGHPKCATNWIRSFLYPLCLRTGINYEVHGGDRSKVFSSRRFESTFNLYVNSLPEHIERLDKNSKGFRMIRDPRICSFPPILVGKIHIIITRKDRSKYENYCNVVQWKRG